ncbi:SCO family protein [Methylomonas sp. LL1]|uniref:SCO family protein n=1 Tax=Methylomonas sp. LL1 TaxID=2785785 RepID=UPI0018C39D63|nr:SCO family protein [Methylomonas sp. LL1]QPK63614.1 SCO family protein [Methylomonas sp. LL1]
MRSTTRRFGRGIAVCLLAGGLFLFGAGTVQAGRLGADYFPNVQLVNQDNQTLKFYDDMLKGKVVAINFIYTHCGDSCPLETAKLRQVQKLLGERVGRDIFIYSISIDPEHDTPAVLNEYKQKFKIGPGWQFLTGTKADIDLIRRKLGMLGDEHDLSDHNVNLIVGNETSGQWLKRTPFDVPQSIAWALGERLQNHAGGGLAGNQDYANATRLPDMGRGEEIFRSRCTACHTVAGNDELGPDLNGVVERRELTWLTRFIKEPDLMLKENDPLARELLAKYKNIPMPNLKLSDEDIQALIEFLRQESKRRPEGAG